MKPAEMTNLEYQDGGMAAIIANGGDGFKILLCMRDPVLSRSLNKAQWFGGKIFGCQATSNVPIG